MAATTSLSLVALLSVGVQVPLPGPFLITKNMKKIDYFKKKNNYSALVCAIPPKNIQNQIDRLMKKWIAGINAFYRAKSSRVKDKWLNYCNKIRARMSQLESSYSRVNSDCFDR